LDDVPAFCSRRQPVVAITTVGMFAAGVAMFVVWTADLAAGEAHARAV
jgi:hypothetical protein